MPEPSPAIAAEVAESVIVARAADRRKRIERRHTHKAPPRPATLESAAPVTRVRRSQGPRVRALSNRECEALLKRNVVCRIAFAHQGHVNIASTHYVYADGWLFARVDLDVRAALRRNRWVAIEVSEVTGIADWQSVVVRGACYATASGAAASIEVDALARGVELLESRVPELHQSGTALPIASAVIRVHAAEVAGRGAKSVRPS